VHQPGQRKLCSFVALLLLAVTGDCLHNIMVHRLLSPHMKRPVRFVLSIAGIIFISLPISILITILLFPFWSWLEASAGIESVGHSGPAEWCYVFIYILLVAGGVLGFLSLRRRKKREADVG